MLGAAEGAVAAAVIVRAVATMRANRPAEARALLTQERARIDETLKHSGALQPARRGSLEQQLAELKALDEECEKLEKTLARALRDAQRAPIKGKASAPDVVGSGRAYAPPPPAMPQAARRSHARAMQALQAN
ncbi:MAG: hypothetical protein H6713_03570 [Myxococcales bacterium]|nr:hypothetical protein [Myxococcales bacterium]